MDIDFKINNNRFLLRCSVIITDMKNTKVILFGLPNKNFWMLPGGRITCQEDSFTAIKREMKEELGITKGTYNLVCIEENFIKAKSIQNIEFVFHLNVDNIDIIKPIEDKDQLFKIVEISKLNNYDLKPNYLKVLINSYNDNNIIHKINIE